MIDSAPGPTQYFVSMRYILFKITILSKYANSIDHTAIYKASSTALEISFPTQSPFGPTVKNKQSCFTSYVYTYNFNCSFLAYWSSRTVPNLLQVRFSLIWLTENCWFLILNFISFWEYSCACDLSSILFHT